jgi:beta-carotene ketolase (CrtW type)
MGVLLGIGIICSWFLHGLYLLEFVQPDMARPMLWLHIIVQAYLSTGLFITAHDAMHGTVSQNKTINTIVGAIACFCFAGMSYKRLIKNHMEHHTYPGTMKDPDYHISQNYFIWFFSFMYRYTTIMQLIIMGLLFNILKMRYAELSIWLFWVIPSLLGAVQLFTFGTYLPHRQPHTHEMQPHNARTLKPNHLLAMITCYFFGYHHEHHSSPRTPWWQLYKLKK